jgi:hypothetical protein
VPQAYQLHTSRFQSPSSKPVNGSTLISLLTLQLLSIEPGITPLLRFYYVPPSTITLCCAWKEKNWTEIALLALVLSSCNGSIPEEFGKQRILHAALSVNNTHTFVLAYSCVGTRTPTKIGLLLWLIIHAIIDLVIKWFGLTLLISLTTLNGSICAYISITRSLLKFKHFTFHTRNHSLTLVCNL